MELNIWILNFLRLSSESVRAVLENKLFGYFESIKRQ